MHKFHSVQKDAEGSIISTCCYICTQGVERRHHRRRHRQKRRQRSSLLFGGNSSFNSMPHYRFEHQDDLNKRMNRRMYAWQNGCFRKINDHLVHTTPNQHPSKIDVLSKSFLQVILAAKWLVRHSSTVHSANSSDDLFLLFCLFLLLWVPFYCTLCVEGVVMDVLVHVHCTVQ